MTDNKHTPGPWKWSDLYETLDGRPTYSLLGCDEYGILSCDGIPNSPHDQPFVGDANARLIAAAPELLAALEKLAPHIPDAVTACHGNKCRQPFCEDCRGEDEAQKAIEAAMEAHLQAIAAIAKARGG